MRPMTLLFSGQDLLLPPGGPAEAFLSETLVDGILGGREPLPRLDFAWGGRAYRALSLEGPALEAALAAGLSPLPFRHCLASWSSAELRPALKALALLNWRSSTRFCGACGAALPETAAEGEVAPGEDGIPALRCPSCGREHFPRISPAVIVLVKKEGRALLARNARMPPGGRFGLLAGFVEAGETLEEAAVREVGEEAGIGIGGLRYVSSQPWPFPDSLMVAFTADWASGEARPDGREIAELRWCSADELPEIPPPGSVARSLIDDFARGPETRRGPA